MKIRTDFVTNSSSSSFVCIGTYSGSDKLKGIVLNNTRSYEDNYEYTPEFYGVEEIVIGGQYGEYVGLELGYLMSHYSELRLDELSAFVADKFNKAFNTDVFTKEDMSLCETGWYDE